MTTYHTGLYLKHFKLQKKRNANQNTLPKKGKRSTADEIKANKKLMRANEQYAKSMRRIGKQSRDAQKAYEQNQRNIANQNAGPPTNPMSYNVGAGKTNFETANFNLPTMMPFQPSLGVTPLTARSFFASPGLPQGLANQNFTPANAVSVESVNNPAPFNSPANGNITYPSYTKYFGPQNPPTPANGRYIPQGGFVNIPNSPQPQRFYGSGFGGGAAIRQAQRNQRAQNNAAGGFNFRNIFGRMFGGRTGRGAPGAQRAGVRGAPNTNQKVNKSDVMISLLTKIERNTLTTNQLLIDLIKKAGFARGGNTSNGIQQKRDRTNIFDKMMGGGFGAGGIGLGKTGLSRLFYGRLLGAAGLIVGAAEVLGNYQSGSEGINKLADHLKGQSADFFDNMDEFNKKNQTPKLEVPNFFDQMDKYEAARARGKDVPPTAASDMTDEQLRKHLFGDKPPAPKTPPIIPDNSILDEIMRQNIPYEMKSTYDSRIGSKESGNPHSDRYRNDNSSMVGRLLRTLGIAGGAVKQKFEQYTTPSKKTGKDIARQYEGIIYKPDDTLKIGEMTVGRGHKITKEENDSGVITLDNGDKIPFKNGITEQDADRIFESDWRKHNQGLMNQLQKEGVDVTKLDPGTLEALKDIAYQSGPGLLNSKLPAPNGTPKLIEALRNNDRDGIAREISDIGIKAKNDRSRVFSGLTNRRDERMKLVPTGTGLGDAVDTFSSDSALRKGQQSSAAPVIINNNSVGGGGSSAPGTGGVKNINNDRGDREIARNMGANDGWELARLFNQMAGLA